MKKLKKDDIRNKRPDPIPFTKEAYEKMEKDFEKLSKEQGEILVRLQTAREMGDLSENGAYKYAKFELGNVRRKLGALKFQLRYGVVVEKKNDGTVDFGAKVKLKNDDREMEFTLVSKHESNPSERKLSTDSPIGAAVIGKSVNDDVEVKTPGGVVKYKLVSIE